MTKNQDLATLNAYLSSLSRRYRPTKAAQWQISTYQDARVFARTDHMGVLQSYLVYQNQVVHFDPAASNPGNAYATAIAAGQKKEPS